VGSFEKRAREFTFFSERPCGVFVIVTLMMFVMGRIAILDLSKKKPPPEGSGLILSTTVKGFRPKFAYIVPLTFLRVN
jgi:hypothetical protein